MAPPRYIKSLNIVPFLQYSLCLDLELMELFNKSNNEWPTHVEYAAYNTSDICYTDNTDVNVIKIVKALGK